MNYKRLYIKENKKLNNCNLKFNNWNKNCKKNLKRILYLINRSKIYKQNK